MNFFLYHVIIFHSSMFRLHRKQVFIAAFTEKNRDSLCVLPQVNYENLVNEVISAGLITIDSCTCNCLLFLNFMYFYHLFLVDLLILFSLNLFLKLYFTIYVFLRFFSHCPKSCIIIFIKNF